MIWPLVAYFAFVVVLVGAILVISSLLGPRHLEPATGEPYEGGIVLLSPNSAVQIIEERTWSGEDTQPYRFKVLFDAWHVASSVQCAYAQH